jgi:hypothetical protein
MSALDAILPLEAPLPNPFTGEVIDRDDLPALKSALDEIERFLSSERAKHRGVYNARDLLQARVVELDPMHLPRASKQTDKQRRVERCPRCKTVLPDFLEPEPKGGVGTSGTNHALDAAGPASSGSEQAELLPEGPRTAEQDAALGLSIFGEKLDKPEPAAAQEAASTDAPAPGEGAGGGSTPSSPSDPIVAQAGEVLIPKGNRAGKSVAWVAENDPDWCLWYLKNGLTETLKAAITTYLYAVKPELMEGR